LRVSPLSNAEKNEKVKKLAFWGSFGENHHFSTKKKNYSKKIFF
jgi:hypothetical protein